MEPYEYDTNLENSSKAILKFLRIILTDGGSGQTFAELIQIGKDKMYRYLRGEEPIDQQDVHKIFKALGWQLTENYMLLVLALTENAISLQNFFTVFLDAQKTEKAHKEKCENKQKEEQNVFNEDT